MAANPLVRTLGLRQIQEREAAIPPPPQDIEERAWPALSGHVRAAWGRNKLAKQRVDLHLLECLRARRGVYSPAQLAVLQQNGGMNYIFTDLTETKCRAASAWIRDVVMPVGERPWALEPTPLAELPAALKKSIVNKALEQAKQIMVQQAQAAQQAQQQPMAPPMPGAPAPVPAMPPEPVMSREDFRTKVAELGDKLRTQAEQTVKKIATIRAHRMERQIDDRLAEGGWAEAMDAFVEDFVTYPAAIMKGPVYQRIQTLTWAEGWVPKVTNNARQSWEQVSPFDIYPAPGAKDCQTGDFIERMRLWRTGLFDLKGLPGFQDEQIDQALKDYSGGHLEGWLWTEAERQRLTQESLYMWLSPPGLIDALNYWGSVPGWMLISWGVSGTDGEPLEPTRDYECNAIVVGRYVVYAALNPDPLNARPYRKACYDDIPGAFWGRSVPDLASTPQKMCNAIACAMADNMAFASGPQYWVHADRFADGENSIEVFPHKVWQLKSDPTQGVNPGFGVFTIPDNSANLNAAYDKWEMRADDSTGIPRYTYGNERVGGAGDALANYERILTPSGPMPIGDAQVGDEVLTITGGVSRITGVFPQGESDIYRLSFSNGEHVDCDMRHRWSVRSHHGRPYQTLTTAQIVRKGLYRKTKVSERSPSGMRPKWMLPAVVVDYPSRPVAIDPYTMGALLGNGDARCRITGMDQEVFDRIPYEKGVIDKKEGNAAWACTIKGVKPKYLAYGLGCRSVEKFIPADYLHNDRATRVELLRGLMDTDGCCANNGKPFFSSSSPRLIADFAKLVRSLGGTVGEVLREEGGEFEVKGRASVRAENYRVHFRSPVDVLFYVKRKQDRFIDRLPPVAVYITGIEPVGRSLATCIEVDAPDRLYVCENLIPTHNTASGLAMLLNSAAKGLRRAIGSIDMGVIGPNIQATFVNEMLYNSDESIKGDCKTIPRGAAAILIKDAAQRNRMQFLSLTANPIDMQIIGAKGRAAVLREVANSMELDTDEIVPDTEKLEQQQAEAARAQAQAAQQQMQAAQAEQEGKMQIEREKIAASQAGAQAAGAQKSQEQLFKLVGDIVRDSMSSRSGAEQPQSIMPAKALDVARSTV